jgi:2'-5' RNA ligase
MDSYLVGLDLPFLIKKELKAVCYGLPLVNWVEEENFHLVLRYIGQINDQTLADLKKALSQVSFLPFSIKLKGIDYFHEKKGNGVLWTDVSPLEPVVNLKKDIDKHLKNLPITPSAHSFKPHVVIGKYERLPSHKLGEYLTVHSLYQTDAIQISQFTLFRTQVTFKRTFYQQIEQYDSNPLIFLD